jgi:hypothetical protein
MCAIVLSGSGIGSGILTGKSIKKYMLLLLLLPNMFFS